MDSKYTHLWCKECGAKYEMDVYGRLHCLTGEGKFEHVPDWYRWEREEVKKEVLAGSYYFEDVVRIEHLDNYQVGYNPIGNIRFVHDMNGLHLHGILKIILQAVLLAILA